MLNHCIADPRRKRLTLIAMSLGFAVVQLDVTVVNTALGSIGSALQGGVTELQWVVTAYTIAFAALILTAGTLGDRFGARRMFMTGFAIFTAASLVCALAPSAAALIAARAVQGTGAAILVPNSLVILNHAYADEEDRRQAVGIWAAGASFALTAGPLAGGALIAFAGWRSIFLINLPIGLGGLWLTWHWAAETTTARNRAFDFVGQGAAIGALGFLAGSIIEGGVFGWGNTWVVGEFATAVVLATAFVLHESSIGQPMMPLDLFGDRLFSLLSLSGVLVNIPFYGLIFVFSLYFQRVNGFSAMMTGLAFLPAMAGVFVANLIAAAVARKIGALPTIAVGSLIVAAGCVALLGTDFGTRLWAISVQLVAIGGGLGLIVPPLTSTLLGCVKKSRSGIAAGILNSGRQTGSVIGVACFGALVGQPSQTIHGLRTALIVSAVLSMIVTLATFGQARCTRGT